MKDKVCIYVQVKLSLWGAIKLRISGINSKKDRKVTIQELIDIDRERQRANRSPIYSDFS